MSSDKEKHDRQIESTKKIILFVIVPLLFLTAGLLGLSGAFEEEPKPTNLEIVGMVDAECYNVNWFGTHGFQITYKTMMENVGITMDSYDMDFTASEFFQDQTVIDHLVVVCPHIDSRLEAPEDFDPDLGVGALDKCLEKKSEFFEHEDFCLKFKP